MGLTNNLVAYYDFEGDSVDQVGTNNGTDTNITYGTSYGKIGQGAAFNGTSSKITFSDIGSHTNFTINIWVKMNAYHDNGYGAIFQCNDGLIALNNEGSVDNINFAVWVDRNGTTGTLKLCSFNVPSTSNYAYWNMYTLTAQGDVFKGYINAKEVGYYNWLKTTEGTSFAYTVLGYNHSNPPDVSDSYINGYMDELGIWSDAKTQAEIDLLYNKGRGLAYPFPTANYLKNYRASIGGRISF